MQNIQAELVSFFDKVAKKDRFLLDKIQNEVGFKVDEKAWQFTLPTLFSFLQTLEIFYSEYSYSQFRKTIYECPINKTIRKNGAEILISKNCRNVDETTYKLIWPK